VELRKKKGKEKGEGARGGAQCMGRRGQPCTAVGRRPGRRSSSLWHARRTEKKRRGTAGAHLEAMVVDGGGWAEQWRHAEVQGLARGAFSARSSSARELRLRSSSGKATAAAVPADLDNAEALVRTRRGWGA
jgi:hypothetical protein